MVAPAVALAHLGEGFPTKRSLWGGSCHDLQTALKFDPLGPASSLACLPPALSAQPIPVARPAPPTLTGPPALLLLEAVPPSAPAGLVAPHCASTLGSAVQRRLAGRRANARVRPQASVPDLARASGEVGRGGCGQESALTLWPAALDNTRKSEGPHRGWGPALRGPRGQGHGGGCLCGGVCRGQMCPGWKPDEPSALSAAH